MPSRSNAWPCVFEPLPMPIGRFAPSYEKVAEVDVLQVRDLTSPSRRQVNPAVAVAKPVGTWTE